MIIKTITCHDVYNVGASLQAYALSAYLKNLGHQVEIINYKPYYLKHYELWGVRNPKYNKLVVSLLYNLAKLPGRLKERVSQRKKVFDSFTKEYLPVTNKTYSDNNELKNADIDADVIFAGSDQIWNTIFPNGKDPAFYLDFASEKTICASYAASLATDDVVEEYKSQVTAWIKRLDFVAVREKSAVGILNRLGIENVQQVMDPVFLLSKDEWDKLLPAKKYNEKYILVYDFDNNESLNNQAKELAEKYDWKIYSVFRNKVCHKDFYNAGPLEFVNLVKNAEMVLSNSFHATAFSIIFEKQFVVFERKEKINTRMRDILSSLEIENGMQINYKTVNNLLQGLILNSKKYIGSVIDAAQRK